MNIKETLKSSLKSSWIVLKLIIPIYILAEVLYFYNILGYLTFLVEPITDILGLPATTALSIISGIFLNLYAAIAFAAPLDLSAKEWTILGLFLGICHTMIVETAIMKKIGIGVFYSVSLRAGVAFIMAFLVSLLPDSYFSDAVVKTTIELKKYNDIFDVLISSSYNAIVLAIKIIALIITVIFIMDFIKSREFIKKSQKNVSKGFSIFTGLFLGITYGAAILIKESQSGHMNKKDIFFVSTFLMICHAIIEDTLLFVIFEANLTVLVVSRFLAAFIFAYLFTLIYEKYHLKN